MSIENCRPSVPHEVVRSLAELRGLIERTADRQWYAEQLASTVAAHAEWRIPGFCPACEAASNFTGTTPAGSTLAAPVVPNYREGLHCPGCGLNNRQRLAAATLRAAIAARPAAGAIYLHEQITPMYEWVGRALGDRREVIGSEYLGPEHAPGAVVDGIRHEDALGLSFADASLDLILSTDVLEHVPRIEPALEEAVRVLRPGGAMVFSIPFHYLEQTTVQRAELQADGTVTHHRPAEFHGNPTRPDEGSLVFYDYGWDLLDRCRAAGFDDAAAIAAWSPAHGIIGERFQLLFVAAKD